MSKFSIITRRTLLLAGSLATLAPMAGCGLTTLDKVIDDPNNPSVGSAGVNATQAQLNALAVGVEGSLRLGHSNNAPNNWMTGVLGREVFVLSSNESRWTQEILGTRGVLDDAAFFSVAAYNGFARVIRASQIFLGAAQNTAVINAQGKLGVAGFCHTYEALAKLHLLNLMGENGIRTDVADYLKPGPFTAGSAPALAHIRGLLDLAQTELAGAGSGFSFPLSSGYNGFNTPSTFLKFNRALAARVALYQKDYAGASTALAGSFYDPAGSLTLGPKLVFAPSSSGDVANPYFQVANGTQPSLLVAAPTWATEAEPGDLRLAKAPLRTGTPRTYSGIPSTYEVRVFPSQTSSLDIIRNEELILISAEAKALRPAADFVGALADINVIRTRAGGLPARTAALTATNVVDEILRQRRYSLFYEGHWWVDLRRLGRLTTNPAPGITLPATTGGIPSGTFKLFDRLQRPFAEKQWDIANP